MARYELPDKETVALVQRVMETRHHALHDAGVTVDVLMAFAENHCRRRLPHY